MLQGNVQIFADIVTAGHYGQDVVREVRRVSIVEPDPFHAGDVSNGVDKFCQFGVSVYVLSVG